MNHNKITTALLLLLAGALFLYAAPQYAQIAYNAPKGHGGPSAVEAVAGIPAVIFTIVGVAGIIGGFCQLIFNRN